MDILRFCIIDSRQAHQFKTHLPSVVVMEMLFPVALGFSPIQTEPNRAQPGQYSLVVKCQTWQHMRVRGGGGRLRRLQPILGIWTRVSFLTTRYHCYILYLQAYPCGQCIFNSFKMLINIKFQFHL